MKTLATAGAVLVVGTSGPRLTDEEKAVFRRLRPGGAILFGRNVETVEQVRLWAAEVRAASPGALLYVDCEGGRVDRLRNLFGGAPAAARLANAPPRLAERAGRWIGEALRVCDLDIDLAPVVDLDHGAEDNALDGRYFGASARQVASRARAFLRGLGRAGRVGCLKHFPGLGAATRDTHHSIAEVTLDAERLKRERVPFEELIRVKGDGSPVPAVLLSHAFYPAIDGSGLPATLSPSLARGLLRDEMRFRGAALTDDLEMKALDPWGDLAERSCRALAAGCDALLICSRWHERATGGRGAGAARVRRPRGRGDAAHRRVAASGASRAAFGGVGGGAAAGSVRGAPRLREAGRRPELGARLAQKLGGHEEWSRTGCRRRPEGLPLRRPRASRPSRGRENRRRRRCRPDCRPSGSSRR